MRKKKLLVLFLTLSMSFSALSGCGNKTVSEAQETTAAETVTETEAESTEAVETAESTEAADENEEAAKQLLSDLTGTYQELWPVILADEYQPVWIENCKKLVGEENAEAAYEKLASMVSGTVYGEEAVKAYADGNGVYDCAFTEGVNTLEFDGDQDRIMGYDADGNELFAHTYHFVGMEDVRGLYEFESDDVDSGEFTYFCIAPDTNATTYHIELRYGSDLDALGKYDEGAYAYWLGSGISTDYDQEMIENCIGLFCTENLSE